MQQVNAVKQQKQVSVFQQPQKVNKPKKNKWDAQSDPKQEQQDQNKQKLQTASVVLDKNKPESQLSKGTQMMKESLKSSQKSQTLRSDKKRFTQNRTTQNNQTLILLQENQIYEKPARDEESASEQYNTYNIEQEHSMIILNEALTRQASKKAFEQLLKENESYRLDASNFGDCIDESQTNKQQQTIQREVQDNQEDLKKRKPEEQEEKENNILLMLHENLYNEESQNYNIELKVNHNFKWLLMEIKYYQDNNKLLYFRKILFLLQLVLRFVVIVYCNGQLLIFMKCF